MPGSWLREPQATDFQIIDNYQDPFVFATCDAVCGTLEEVADALKHARSIQSSGFDIVDRVIKA